MNTIIKSDKKFKFFVHFILLSALFECNDFLVKSQNKLSNTISSSLFCILSVQSICKVFFWHILFFNDKQVWPHFYFSIGAIRKKLHLVEHWPVEFFSVCRFFLSNFCLSKQRYEYALLKFIEQIITFLEEKNTLDLEMTWKKNRKFYKWVFISNFDFVRIKSNKMIRKKVSVIKWYDL